MRPPPLIAIVDDDEGVRRALRRLLRSLSYEPIAFASGEAFLDSLPQQLPGCVLMDLHLSGLNGIEVLERLRTRSPATPVIVMTGFDESGVREKCLAAGASDYITKPFDSAYIVHAIDRVIRTR
jgi:FixJ family two-component response regulator